MDDNQDLVQSEASEGSQSEVVVTQSESIDYVEQLDQIIMYQSIDIALLCVLIGVMLSVSIMQIFNRYL